MVAILRRTGGRKVCFVSGTALFPTPADVTSSNTAAGTGSLRRSGSFKQTRMGREYAQNTSSQKLDGPHPTYMIAHHMTVSDLRNTDNQRLSTPLTIFGRVRTFSSGSMKIDQFLTNNVLEPFESRIRVVEDVSAEGYFGEVPHDAMVHPGH